MTTGCDGAKFYLLARADDLLEIILLGEALDGGECFTSVSLLDPDVD